MPITPFALLLAITSSRTASSTESFLTSQAAKQGSEAASGRVLPLCLVAHPSTQKVMITDAMSAMAEELDAIGQVRSVTYELQDPIFREAVFAGKLPKLGEFYSLGEVQKSAKTLGCPYVLTVAPEVVQMQKSVGGRNALKFSATLFKNGKQIWTDTEVIEIGGVQNQSSYQTIRTITSSLALKIADGPLKELPKNKKVQPEPAGKGQAPVIPDNVDDDATLNDFAAIQEQVKTYVLGGRHRAAEMLLRDAVDAAPKDSERRKALIEFLQSRGKSTEAIEATLLAGQALNDASLSTLAAKIMIESGRVSEASTIVNELLAVNPGLVEARVLAADLRLREADPGKALSHLEVALKSGSTTEIMSLRCLCRALLGSEDGVKLDLEKLTKDDPTGYGQQYGRLLSIFDSAFDTEAKTIEALIQQAVLPKDSEAAIEGIEAQERLANACLVLLGENAVNLRFQKSHGLRVLALNLLVQSMTELKQFVAKKDKEALVDARIDFGEMVKTLQSAKAAFQSEVQNAGVSRASG